MSEVHTFTTKEDTIGPSDLSYVPGEQYVPWDASATIINLLVPVREVLAQIEKDHAYQMYRV